MNDDVRRERGQKEIERKAQKKGARDERKIREERKRRDKLQECVFFVFFCIS